MILLTVAIEKELAGWKARPDVTTLLTGVGPVEAACSVSHALAAQRYKLVINAGIAGAFDGVAPVGTGVVVADDWLELGREDGHPIVLPEGSTIADRVASDPVLVARLSARGLPALHGVTVSRVTGSEDTAARLAAEGAQVETMEGFAVLRAATLAGVPAIALRGISNRVGLRERSGWNFHAGIEGMERALRALFELLDASHQGVGQA